MNARFRIPLTIVTAAVVALGIAACGGDDSSSDEASSQQAAGQADLVAIKAFLLDQTKRLQGEVADLRQGAERYYELAKAADFDYDRLLSERRQEVRRLVEDGKRQFAAANPAYERMEGVVAGVPSLADFDVSIDAGSDASDPENAVPFSIRTPEGKTFKQPGNFNYLIETSVFGTEPKFAARGVRPDLDGDGRVEFGEAVPDASFYVAAARDFEGTVGELGEAAREWEPTMKDALTALVVMTPTMSEYFEAWKNSRFVAGNRATEKAFVVASRLQDITDILSGLVLIYDNVQPQIARTDAQQARQTATSLERLHDFAARLRDAERGGRRFTAGDADSLGSDAQDQAEAIAGQISQVAGRMNIELET
jgi:hypothetical protein